MKRKIFHIISGLLILLLLIFGLLYVKNKNIDNDTITGEDDVTIKGVWFSSKYDFYEDDNMKTFEMNNLKLSFSGYNINICDIGLDKCEDVKYEVTDNFLKIIKGKEEIFFGEFKFYYQEEMLLLEDEHEDGDKVVYYFLKSDNN